MASVGTGNLFLSRTSLCFLWISLTFHSWPDLCFHTDFCTRAFPSSSSLLWCCGTTPAKKAGRALASACPEPEKSLQGNLLLCLTPEELGLCRRRGKCRVLCCCAPGLSSQDVAPAHPWDPRWAACDGQALEQLIWDSRDTSQQSKVSHGDSAAEELGGEPQPPAQRRADFFPCRQGKESMSSSVLSPPKHAGSILFTEGIPSTTSTWSSAQRCHQGQEDMRTAGTQP